MAAAGTIIIGGGGYALLRYIGTYLYIILYWIVFRRDTEIFATYNYTVDDNNEEYRVV